ncbi:DUF6175 family protein [Alistipes sp. An66]|uniref:DUF6175 family protein n=1 Tax=Alistipes sp. An66 TaxID=1965650 RepID=UPI000B38534B|nr:DUF6175 family protein [Alistipes sp. An66]
MKKLILTLLATSVACGVFAQAKKPTIMVVPSDAWCIRNGFIQEFNDQGVVKKVCDYQAAMQNNADIRTLVAAMGDFMAQQDFPIQSLEQELKRLQNQEVDLSVITGKETGAIVTENDYERIIRRAKPDIRLDLDFEVRRIGPKRQVSFNLTAIDAYSSKIISGNTGVGSSSSGAAIETLLQEAVLSFKDNFIAGLLRYFDDLFNNGREITVYMQCFDSSPIDFETEFDYNGQTAELADIIGVWFEENTLNGRFSEAERSTNILRYNQVRIPLYGKSLSGREVAIDATAFARPLANMLKKDPYNVVVKTVPKGLGEIWLFLGEK